MNDEREQMGDRIQVLPPPKAKPQVMPEAEPQAKPRWGSDRNWSVIIFAWTIVVMGTLAIYSAHKIGFF
jgi:hypothetical protein